MQHAFRHLAPLLVFLPALAAAQAGPPPPVDSTLVVTSTEIRDAFTLADAGTVADARLRLVPVGAYNVGISVVRRSLLNGRTPPDAIVHDRITEVYEIREGRGLLVIGGTLDDPQPFPPDSPVVLRLIGPSTRGTTIRGGMRRLVGPGDIVVIPPRTPHGFAALLTPAVTYVLIRVDGDHVLRTTAP